MKKIIAGRVYDTDTANELAVWSNAGSWRDFNHVEETLYRKRTGEFFLYGEGGPATRYAKGAGQNSWTGSWQIIPLTVEAARKWAEEHLDADEYAEIFGLPDETTEAVALIAQVPAKLAAKVKTIAAEQGITAEELIIKALTQITQ